MRKSKSLGTLATLLVVVAVGCSGSLPAIEPPDIDAQAAGVAAIKKYDRDGDNLVNGEELERAPSLGAALDRLDENGDGAVSAAEVQKLAESWSAGSVPAKAIVLMNGRPLVEATVTFDPETFLGEGVVPTAAGMTDRNGFVVVEIPEAERAHPNGRYPAPGLYLVRISKEVNGKETIPDRYNKNTELGVEVARRASYMPGSVEFELSSR